jgi:hypothetical protein
VNARIQALLNSEIDPESINPESDKFDPIKAIISLRHTNYDEACWLSFLLIYTDDSAQTEWAFMKSKSKSATAVSAILTCPLSIMNGG